MPESGSSCIAGLRVDVDTYRGTRDGVPALLDLFDEYGISASIFFSIGPDNMGRHLRRLLRPAFLLKMLRSKAASLYGWDILLRGTLWPGPVIGRAFAATIRQAASRGHEVGLHAWDHHAWQARLGRMSYEDVVADVARGMGGLADILGTTPVCSAAAGWQCNDSVLRAKESWRMRYNSDCRGTGIFRPLVDGRPGTPQIPVTLPTYDELIGRNDINDANYNDTMLDRIRRGSFNVLAIHAEVEGIAKQALFRQFLEQALEQKIRFVPLGDFLSDPVTIPVAGIRQGRVSGRDGLLCVQAA